MSDFGDIQWSKNQIINLDMSKSMVVVVGNTALPISDAHVLLLSNSQISNVVCRDIVAHKRFMGHTVAPEKSLNAHWHYLLTSPFATHPGHVPSINLSMLLFLDIFFSLTYTSGKGNHKEKLHTRVPGLMFAPHDIHLPFKQTHQKKKCFQQKKAKQELMDRMRSKLIEFPPLIPKTL